MSSGKLIWSADTGRWRLDLTGTPARTPAPRLDAGFEEIVEAAARVGNIRRELLLTDRRKRASHHRMLAALAMARLLKASKIEIGRQLGRHHTTIMNALDVAASRVAASPAAADALAKIEARALAAMREREVATVSEERVATSVAIDEPRALRVAGEGTR